MPDPRRDDEPERPSPREEVAGSGGLDETDDTTEADQGMPAGTGAAPAEGTAQPQATDPLTDEEEQAKGE